MFIFWDVAPCTFIETDRLFRAVYCLYDQSDDVPCGANFLKRQKNYGEFAQRITDFKMEPVSNTETSVSVYETMRRNIPEDGYLVIYSNYTCAGIFLCPVGRLLL
jgi:hypothetical protein